MMAATKKFLELHVWMTRQPLAISPDQVVSVLDINGHAMLRYGNLAVEVEESYESVMQQLKDGEV